MYLPRLLEVLASLPPTKPVGAEAKKGVMVRRKTEEKRTTLPDELILLFVEQVFSAHCAPLRNRDGLIDLKPLVACAVVNKQWNRCTIPILYSTLQLPTPQTVQNLLLSRPSPSLNHTTAIRISFPLQYQNLHMYPAHLIHIIHYTPRLTFLHLGSTYFTPSNFLLLSHHTPDLKELSFSTGLSLRGDQNSDWDDFCCALKGWKHLKILRMEGLALWSARGGVGKAVAGCAALESLSLRGCKNAVLDGDLQRILFGVKQLKGVDFSGCVHLTDATLHTLATLHGNTVTSINLSQLPNITDAGIAGLSLCTRIRSVVLNNTNVTDAGIRSLVKNCGDTLERLGLTGCDNISSLTLSHISTYCHALTHLSLSLTSIPDAALAFLTHNWSPFQPRVSTANTLQYLWVVACPNVTVKGVRRIVEACVALRQVLVSGVFVNMQWEDGMVGRKVVEWEVGGGEVEWVDW
ncbi:Transcription factor COE1 [Rhizophlyctis rosea]|nr:Transcription factor COE1 [Rhizophlyctis rosea]